MPDEITKTIQETVADVGVVTEPTGERTVITEDPVVIDEPLVIVPEVSSSPIPSLNPVPEASIKSPELDSIVEPVSITPESNPETELNSKESAPISIPEPVLETSHSQLEPNPRPYSLDPKLNKMIEAFVRGMNNSKQNLILAQKAVKAKMMKKVYKIMDLFKKHKKIKNDDVEKFLHTDDTTATRYLNILTKEGKVKREGNPHNPHYTKVE